VILRFWLYGERLRLSQGRTAKDDSASRSKSDSPEQGLSREYFVSLNG